MGGKFLLNIFICIVCCMCAGLCEAVGLAACNADWHSQVSSSYFGMSGRELHQVVQTSS